VIHEGVPYDPIQGQGHAGLRVAKMTNFKVYLFRRYACSKKANDELW